MRQRTFLVDTHASALVPALQSPLVYAWAATTHPHIKQRVA